MGDRSERFFYTGGPIYAIAEDGTWKELKWAPDPWVVHDPTPTYTETAKDLAKARWYLDHALTHLGDTK